MGKDFLNGAIGVLILLGLGWFLMGRLNDKSVKTDTANALAAKLLPNQQPESEKDSTDSPASSAPQPVQPEPVPVPTTVTVGTSAGSDPASAPSVVVSAPRYNMEAYSREPQSVQIAQSRAETDAAFAAINH